VTFARFRRGTMTAWLEIKLVVNLMPSVRLDRGLRVPRQEPGHARGVT